MVTAGGVRLRLIASITLVVAIVALAALRLFALDPPTPGWAGVVLLAFMAVGVFFAALPVRRILQGRATKALSPLRAARSLVLAQAAALTGAGLVGWYAAQAVALLPNLDVDSQRARLWLLLGHLVAGAVLVVSGLLAQRMCRIDDDPGSLSERQV
ncbi:MAG: DUF3180 domain-containing protein [Candidatus Phosphoribacter sp.]|nr:DUF3180 domain-containing protein [Actinomycetales bacterium]